MNKSQKASIEKLRLILIDHNEKVSDIEFTTGNYDDKGILINKSIPTITTEFCEIGIYNETLYFVYIIHSKSFNENFFDKIIKENVQIYSFKNFKTNLYPQNNFKYANFVKKINNEKLLQIQINFDYNKNTIHDIFKHYKNIKKLFIQNDIKVVNQLKNT